MITTIPIFLTEEQAKEYVLLQKRSAFIHLMEEMGVFNMKNGSITLHFDGVGQIKTVERHEFLRI